ncbi:hypothetical protein [Roseivivax lentus]|nr:hypothetical protein [Roseivivax lentus]
MAAIDTGGPQIIIDRSLALDLHGPLVTLRLAAECDTWLASSVFRQLDDSLVCMSPLLASPEANIAPLTGPEDERAVMVWQRARVLTAGRRLYWLADCREDAHLPEWAAAESHSRFEILHKALYSAAPNTGDDAALDAIVMAAAFQERPAAILARCGKHGTPDIVREAGRYGLNVIEIDTAFATEARDTWFGPLLMRTGLYEWAVTAQTPLVYARLIAPDLLFLDTEFFDVDDGNALRMSGWPLKATLLWGRL